jgi:hypothetical protein
MVIICLELSQPLVNDKSTTLQRTTDIRTDPKIIQIEVASGPAVLIT